MSKKVIVTGGVGFIGAHTCERFVKRGWKTIAYDNMTKFELNRTGYNTIACRDYNYKLLNDWGVEIVCGDIRDKDLLYKTVGDDCDFIIHTAAQPAITISVEDPDLDFSTNVIGTLNLLELARVTGIPMVNCATIHVYGNTFINSGLRELPMRYVHDPESIPETYPLATGTLTQLHASKITADTYVRAYVHTYKAKVASFRLTGLYGPRQFGGEDHGWVANFAIRTIMDLPLTVYGNGKQVRDILFATDVARAFECYYYNQRPGVYNIGGGIKNSISLLECIYAISNLVGKEPVVEYKPDRIGDLRYFVCDSSKAKKFMGWEPLIDTKTGLWQITQWIQENKELFHAD